VEETSVLDDAGIRRELWQAWLDSRPDEPDVHEEGGFILRDVDGNFSVERW
jgi:hypothetical protein